MYPLKGREKLSLLEVRTEKLAGGLRAGGLKEHLLWEAFARAEMAGKLMTTLQNTPRGGT